MNLNNKHIRTGTAARWTVKPSCLPKSCPSNPSIDHMNGASTNCAGTGHNTKCEVKCNSGYRRSHVQAKCMYGTWREKPSCNPKSCDSDPSIVHMIASSTTCAGTLHNRECEVVCDVGYSPSRRALCELGDWTRVPTCDPNPCGTLPSVPHLEGNCGTSTLSGHTCTTVSCSIGYTISGRAFCTLGQWTELPSCNPNSCT